MTTPEEFNNNTFPVVFDEPLPSPAQGALAVQRAWAEVQRGVLWTWFDNCQDFVNRARKGQNGSPTRNLVFGMCALGLLLAVAVNSK